MKSQPGVLTGDGDQSHSAWLNLSFKTGLQGRTTVIPANEENKRNPTNSRDDCVSVNTAIAGICLNFAGRDGRPKKFDRLAGAKAAREERLDARGSGQKTSIARLEYQP